MTGRGKWLPVVSAVGIAFFSLSGIFQMPNLDVEPRPSPILALVILLFLLAFAIISLATMRLTVLPAALALPEAKREQLLASSYAFAVAPSVYGLVVALFTRRGLLVLPFTAIAACGWFMVWSYLREAASDNESPAG